ncbi:hypothetical protein TNCV_1714661 [Trichonephila clavipes]|nr:hypothetical protein TNCV_1714661 [Trichonephila clavipes]
MGLYERKSAVLDGDFEWVCSTITSQNIYGRTPMILLTMRPSRLFVKIRCHAVASTRKRSAVRKASEVAPPPLIKIGTKKGLKGREMINFPGEKWGDYSIEKTLKKSSYAASHASFKIELLS